MASKNKTQRLEAEIDKCRVECNWKKSLEVAKQSSAKLVDFATIALFLQAEIALEEFIETHDPTKEEHMMAARQQLTEANTNLMKVSAGPSPLKVQADLLLAKVQFCQGFYAVALTTLGQVDLAGLAMAESEGTSLRSIRLLYIVAESYAIKGKCIEKTKTSQKTKFKASERDEEVISCFEIAGDLAFLCLQLRDKSLAAHQSQVPVTPGTVDSPNNFIVSALIEMAIGQLPQMYLHRGKEQRCISRYREMLRAVESRFSQDIRKTLALELAQLLLRSCSVTSYPLMNVETNNDTHQTPKPCVYSSEKLFVPKTLDEEVLLLLLIAEAVGTREAVLERSTETHEIMFTNITTIYDLLALVLVKRGQFGRLTESFEKAMRFSFQEFHIWYQYANSLISAGKYAQAVQVLSECHSLAPDNAAVCLQAAQVCYEHLHKHEQGLDWSRYVVHLPPSETPNHIRARGYMAQGIGLCLVAKDSKLLADRQKMDNEALKSFEKAHELDPKDYLCAFHLGLQYANMRKISVAMSYVKLSLKHRSDFIHALHLLTLLLSAKKKFEEALSLINAALEEYPDNLNLLMTKAKLQKIVEGPEEALNTYKWMLKLWKEQHDQDQDEFADQPQKVSERGTWDKRGHMMVTFHEFGDSQKGSGSVRTESVAASRVEKALSDLASSMNSSYQPRVGPQRSWVIQAQIWLNLAELYLSLNQVNEAQSCVQETFQLFPHSVYVFYLKGLVLEHRGFWGEAKVCFENAVAVNPSHTKSLLHLGMVLHNIGDNRLAEKTLRDAINLDPHFHKAWFVLGTVLEAIGEPEDSSNCHIMGAFLEDTCPVAAFNVIQRVMR